MSCTYNCAVCQLLYKNFNPAASANVLITEHYYGQYWVAMGGRETGGERRGQYSLPGGKMDPQDGGCFRRAALRELSEELHFTIPLEQFDTYFRRAAGTYRFIMQGRTPVFYCRVPGLSRNKINPQLASAQRNHYLPSCQREMDHAEWFRFDNGLTPEGNRLPRAQFLIDVMRRVNPST